MRLARCVTAALEVRFIRTKTRETPRLNIDYGSEALGFGNSSRGVVTSLPHGHGKSRLGTFGLGGGCFGGRGTSAWPSGGTTGKRMGEEGILKRSAGVARRDIERDGAPASKVVRVRVKISPSSIFS